MTKSKRVNIRGILADPDLRRKLMVSTVQATQAREGIETTKPQAERAYYVVHEGEKSAFFSLKKYRAKQESETDRREEIFISTLREDLEGVRFDILRRDFSFIEGEPLAYRSLNELGSLFRNHPKLNSWADVEGGMNSTESDRFIRYHWEIDPDSMRAWTPFSKGGSFSRFYYDIELVIDWTNSGEIYKGVVKEKYGSASRFVKSESFYRRPGITWTEMTSKGLNAKKLPPGAIFNCKGPCAFPKNEEDSGYILSILNSSIAQALMNCLTSRSYGSTYVAKLPIPLPDSSQKLSIENKGEEIFQEKYFWDTHNEISSRFLYPWLLSQRLFDSGWSFNERLDYLIEYESMTNARIQKTYADLDKEVYLLYGIYDRIYTQIKKGLGDRPPELIWSQMKGKDTDQKRMEHVWRLLSYVVKRVVEADEDGIVPLIPCAGETRLLERVQHEIAELFPDQDITQVEVAIVNELKRKVKGYRRTESIQEWLETVYFDYHASLYKERPIFWHIASTHAPNPAAFSALVHYHRFDHNRLAKLRSHYLRDAIDLFRREAALAGQEGRADDRLDWQTRLEEAETLEQRLKWVQEGYHEGAEDGSNDYRILTPWKTPAERPNGWKPDLDDGVAVNIAPLQKAGVLRIPKVV